MFADEARIIVRAGRGGNGSVHFRREKFVPLGGPDGGDGGRGGSVYFVAEPTLNSLVPFVYRRNYEATPGQPGTGRQKHGAKGKDLVVKVPPGTIVRDAQSNEILADVLIPGEKVLICRAGRGGLGNAHFATAVHQAPKVADKGEPGETRQIQLELKLIAEVGIIGMPNAGKSTLLSVVSAARPKIASYPFTTLQPELGVATIDDRTIVFADIPGMIQGAHLGVGLGHAFLRHVERTRLLVHVVDGSGQEGRDPFDDYRVINDELQAYSPALARRPQIVVVNKMDLPETAARWPTLRRELAQRGTLVLSLSAATRQGVPELLAAVAQRLDSIPDDQPPMPQIEPTRRPDFVHLEREGDVWRALGPLIERIVAMTDLGSPEGVDRLRSRLAQTGVEAELLRRGARHGDTLLAGDSRWRLSVDHLRFDGSAGEVGGE